MNKYEATMSPAAAPRSDHVAVYERAPVEETLNFAALDAAFDRLPDQGHAYRLLFTADEASCVEALRKLLGLPTIDQTMKFVQHRIAQPMPHYHRLVTLHEAAHAVAAVQFRHNLRCVVHRPKAQMDGWVLIGGWKPLRRQLDGTARRRWSRKRLVRVAHEHVIGLLVGYSAMQFADPSWSIAGDEDDFLKALDVLGTVHGDEFEALNVLEDELLGPAEQFVRENWAAISAVGDTLLQRGQLTGREVREIVAATKDIIFEWK